MNTETSIRRREAVERIALILGGTLSTQLTSGLMGQITNSGPSVPVDDSRKRFLAEVADVIIPDTDTPGARAAGVEEFIVRVMRDCYELKDQEKFYGGLDKLDQASQARHGKAFVDLDGEKKIEMIRDAVENNRDFYRRMREMTITGYFTSEIGATQALEYLPIPGRFEGDVPMQPGQKAWAISR